MKLEKANSIAALVVKSVSVLAISLAIIGGSSAYLQYAHSGPSCDNNGKSFQFWIDAKRPKLAIDRKNGSIWEIVSIQKARLQTENGTTKCFGTVKDQNGKFKDWSGHITVLADKTYIGSASVKLF